MAESQRRKELLNTVHHLKGNIRVLCRVRPVLPSEQSDEKGDVSVNVVDEESLITSSVKNGRNTDKRFDFDRVFGPGSSQEQVFDEVQATVESVLDGYNACIFAYGQTGSGKTYTMSGDQRNGQEKVGVNARAIDLLYKLKEQKKDSAAYSISVMNVEIYCEKIHDLLAEASDARTGVCKESGKKLQIKEGRDGVYVSNCVEIKAESVADVLDAMKKGDKNRSQSETNMNKYSSRSHSVVVVSVNCEDRERGRFFRSKLVLVDLAGSERVTKSGVTGKELKEAQAINKSLSCLGDVFAAIEKKQNHIPYRNSKLTSLLKDALGKDNKAVMIVQVSPTTYNVQETNSSLLFATRVKHCELGKAQTAKNAQVIDPIAKPQSMSKANHAASKRQEEKDIMKVELKRLASELASANIVVGMVILEALFSVLEVSIF